MMPLFEMQRPKQVSMSGLLSERVVCVVRVFCRFFVTCSTLVLRNATRMSMTVVVRERLCVYAGSAWAL